jgi:opacity protein-like surface antigen
MLRIRSVVLLALLASACAASSQTAPVPAHYSRLNTFGVFGEYSNDSSHIILGTAENRKLLDFGGGYSRRVLLNRFVEGQYMLELRPIMLESDPLAHQTIHSTSPPPPFTVTSEFATVQACHPFSATFTSVLQGVTYSNTTTLTCGRQWTFGEGFSPLGFKWNFRPRHRIQPVISLLGGYMFATKPIPVADAGSWNFTFEFGGGVEWYRSATRSIRAEYRIHHISNKDTAAENPGIDNGLFQVTYSFGH